MFWKTQDTNTIVKAYKKVLEQQILEKPMYLEILDKILNPILRNSITMYYQKK